MVIRARGELLSVTDKVALTATFYDSFGVPANTDTVPKVSIVQPSGNVLFPLTSGGVQQIATGKYTYAFEIPYAGPLGVWNDIWQGTVAGVTSTQTLNFVTFGSNLYEVLSPDGYVHLGQDPGFHYSQTAILNINKLLKMLKARLNSSGKMQVTNPDGSISYVDCDIFSIDMLVTFLATSLEEFNAIPHFTTFTFDNTGIIDLFGSIIVEGALVHALSSQALLERGREFALNDNGVSFTPPTVSEIMMTQFGQIYTAHIEKLKLIKASMKPGPLGLGSMNGMGGSPLLKRMSMLRARRLF